MNFHLSDEQAALQDAVRRFAAEQAEAGVRRRAFESEDGLDRPFWDGLVALGVGGVGIAEEFGGLGLDWIDVALVAEALGYEAAPGPFLGHVVAALAIQRFGTEPQKQAWLPRLATGEKIGTVALAEAGERWRPKEWSLGLDGHGRLSGAKANVPYAAVADVLVVGLSDGGLALVASEAGGLACEPLDVADRTRRLWNVTFRDARAERLPAGDCALLRDALCVLLAADAFGGAMRVLHMTAEYAKTREQFGQAIARFQGVKHQLANLAAEIAPCQGLYWYAAVAFEQAPDERAQAAAMAKAHLGDRFMEAGRTAVELHGGIGYTWEYDLQIWVKRAMFDFAFGGPPSLHRARAMSLTAPRAEPDRPPQDKARAEEVLA
ncbi:acyl-CoA dehydrogenase [Phenylobacterium zucineum HLK1]|uniref:Acyl-CoA dehydrogenase n=1 Tax=Phenylobacterium zucineum (strain HLK1) TaxID=450851 RepID=B4RH01_PHEZH|nr:acyl-CoA dehydrogenase family protein [Phenylobacterium zucineum]ACG78949.1 acyl-CoA dehydrogenase [Phenylobacterium zucineum HLK1]